jgi:hypothetical protein
MMFNKVDLPQPEGPVSTTNERGSIVIAMSFSTGCSPRTPDAG